MLSDSTSLVSSSTGTCFRAPTADLWGPDEARVSRPVLREREGATPSRHSPVPHAGICAEAARKGGPYRDPFKVVPVGADYLSGQVRLRVDTRE
jgi:hypothetical protein